MKSDIVIIKKSSIKMTCSGCPTQWDATTIDNQNVSIRVRHGNFTLDIDGVDVFHGSPKGIDGVMDTEEMINYVNSTTSRVKFI